MNSTQDSHTAPHPSSIDNYIRKGWKLCAIPPYTKGPTQPGWNLEENALVSAANKPQEYGVGLMHAYSGTCSIDIDHWDTAVRRMAEQGIDLNALWNDPRAVKIHSGKQGHAKLIYALDTPLVSKKLIETAPDNSKYNYIDFRCATSNGKSVQDVLPPTLHPDTRQSYTWEGDWQQLPPLPESLHQYWLSLIERDSQVSITDNRKPLCSVNDIEGALYHIDPDLDREQWVHVGMALHDAGTQTGQLDEMLWLWNDWSKQSEVKYNERDLINAWNSFDSGQQNRKTIGTLFHIAKEHGWEYKVDVTGLFAPINNDPESEVSRLDVFTDFEIPPPQIDMTLLPPILRTRAEEVAREVGCDPVVPVLAGLVATCAAADGRSRLNVAQGFSVPPVLWCVTVGSPSDRKSPGAAPMFKELDRIEFDDRPFYKKRLLEWETKEERHRRDHANYIDAMIEADLTNGNVLPPDVTELPPKPQPLRMVVEDATSQKLIHICEHRPYGVAAILDEMQSLVHKLNDRRTGEDHGTWIAGYESRSYRMDRIGSGEKFVDMLSIALYGNMQPRVAEAALGVGAATADGGLIQRALFGVLQFANTKKPDPVPEMLSSAPQWNQMLRNLRNMPAMDYHMSPEASAVFDQFQDWYHAQLAKERIARTSSHVVTALGKATGTVARIAFVCHLMSSPWETTLSGETMARACDLYIDYFLPSVRHVVNEVAGESTQGVEAWIRRHILVLSSFQDQVTTSEIVSASRRQWGEGVNRQTQTEVVNAVLDSLESVGWVKYLPMASDMMRRKFAWAINPKPAEVFEQQRKALIEAQQEKLDDILSQANRKRTKNDQLKRRFSKGYAPSENH
jgi:hypothetical protein